MTAKEVAIYLERLLDNEKLIREAATQGLRNAYDTSEAARAALHASIPTLRGGRLVAVLNVVSGRLRHDHAAAAEVAAIVGHPEDWGTDSEIAQIGQAACQALYGAADFPDVRSSLIRAASDPKHPPQIRAIAVSSLGPSYDLPDARQCIHERSSDSDPEIRTAAVQAMANATARGRIADDGYSTRLTVLASESRDLADRLYESLLMAIEVLLESGLTDEQVTIVEMVISPNCQMLHSIAHERGIDPNETTQKRESGVLKAAAIVGAANALTSIAANVDKVAANAQKTAGLATEFARLFLSALQ